MYRSKNIISLLLMLCMALATQAQQVRIEGLVYDADTGRPIEFASILLTESGQWAVSNERGEFSIKNVPQGKSTLTVQCLGYQKRSFPMELNRDVTDMRLRLKPENLRLEGVTVTAKRKTDEATTSYTIDRQTLDNQQILNVSDIATLLPGGKTVNPTLMSDSRMALRSGSQEKGNASFGTAIEVDGIRLDNNAMPGETMGASTRTIGASNIESVEIVTGIPSVEYGDLSNGIVKVNTRRGKSPFIVESKLNQHTRQLSLNKGFDLGRGAGVLNASVEHARSFSNAASPHTAYQRNVLSLHYMNSFMQETTPLTLNLGLTGNLGGYNSEADPDQTLDSYAKARDNALRANFELQWLLNQPWITNVLISGSLAYSDRKSENYSYTSSASTLPYIHTTEEGYFMAADYDENTQPPIILSPTGYWYVRDYSDSKPLSWALKLKADWNRRFGSVANRLTMGSQYTGSRNNGRGHYYEELRLAPTWREYRYDEQPTMHNLAVYAEDKVMVPTTRRASLELTAGLRGDITMIGSHPDDDPARSLSDYGTVSSLSPRLNSRYVFWQNQRKRWVSSLELHAGWGKSVKLPSFQVLYPAPSYTDREVFASVSNAANQSFRAYHTQPQLPLYNPDLRWQHTHQVDVGVEANIKGTRITLSAFYHRTNRTYMSKTAFTPFSYQYTADPNTSAIATADRQYAIDRQSGVVTVSDATGLLLSETLSGTQRRTFATSTTYANAESPIHRYGLEWIVDFAQIKPLQTSVRLDGNYYYYKGIDDVLFADIPLGVNSNMSDGSLYQYVGYYRGSNVTSTGYAANAAIANGSLSRQLNLNATITTHIPKIRMIIALRLESSLYSYRRSLSEFSDGTRGYMLTDANGYTGQPYDGHTENTLMVVYPQYYATWDNPEEMIPFAERFLWAKDNDPVLFSDLSKLVVRSNYAYTMNPDRLSAYYSANLSVTKEIGDHVSLSFYANNFFRNMAKVHSSQTDLETSLFASSYIPSFYYGLSLRLKL